MTASRGDLADRIDLIEETYEFLLAYAAQGITREEGARQAAQARDYLQRASLALTGMGEAFTRLVEESGLEPEAAYDDFIAVLARDADAARAAFRLVLAQTSISSQLVDNLNASIHVRALLTDLFLVDEVLASHLKDAPAS